MFKGNAKKNRPPPPKKKKEKERKETHLKHNALMAYGLFNGRVCFALRTKSVSLHPGSIIQFITVSVGSQGECVYVEAKGMGTARGGPHRRRRHVC